jgi:hypothetical protein
MDDAKHSPSRPRIDVTELNYVEVTEDGRRLRLHVLDGGGGPALVSLPVHCLNLVVTAVPPAFAGLVEPAGERVIHDVDSWSLEHGEAGLVLTLRQPDSAAIAFSLQSWQIEAIASLIHVARPGARERLH